MREQKVAGAAHDSAARTRAVRIWLLCVAGLMVVVLLVGGATRLTESGLSITEWQPVAGALPPLSSAQWQDAFAKYQTIPQYSQLNHGMTLEEFKTIFWWEWSHRLLARSVGFVFLLPFLYFLSRGAIPRELRARLWLIFSGGAALGAVGWWMVASGLSERVSVSQYRLAFHLTLACAIYGAILWTAQQLAGRPAIAVPGRLRAGAIGLMFLVVVQIYLGALVAGLDAGLAYNTWPLIDGAFIPDASRLFFDHPPWRNFFENVLTVQFDHRMVAYALLLAALAHAVDAARHGPQAFLGALIVAAAIALQAGLGIFTLLLQVPLPLALMHQGMAVLVLTLSVLHAQRLRLLRATAAGRLETAEAKS